MSKEKIYDEQVFPLMAQIVEICQKNGVAMVASFAISNEDDPNLRCSTHLADETGAFPFADMYRLLMHGRRQPTLMLTTRDGDGNVKSMTAIVG